MKSTSQLKIIPTALHDLILTIPSSKHSQSATPKRQADLIIAEASKKAALASAALALPPGIIGLSTIVPDLLTVWRIQAQMVADIAATYGKTPTLTKETMLICLFCHGSAHLLRDVMMRAGERVIIRRASLRAMQEILANLGIKITQKLIGKASTRFIPFAGAAAVGAYAMYDTKQVGKSSIEIFSNEIVIAEE